MPKKTKRPAKKKAKSSVTFEEDVTPVATQSDAPTVELPVQEVVVVDEKKEEDETENTVEAGALVLSDKEKEFIIRLREDDQRRSQFEASREAELKKTEEETPEESAYAAIFAPVQTLNAVHAHCSGVIKLRPLELRDTVQKAVVLFRQSSGGPHIRRLQPNRLRKRCQFWQKC